MNDNRDVMMDIETLGTKPGSIVLSVGLVRFNPRPVGAGNPVQSSEVLKMSSLRVNFDAKELAQKGFLMDADTVKWWVFQGEEARKNAFDPSKETIKTLAEGLADIQRFFEPKDRVWGNGANFDIPLVEALYDKSLWSKYPWGYSKVRCYRTVKAMCNWDTSLVPENELWHDPVADCIHQIQTLQAIAYCNPTLLFD